MDRRGFLQRLPAFPALGVPWLHARAATYSAGVIETADTSIASIAQNRVVRVAIFPSEVWGPRDIAECRRYLAEPRLRAALLQQPPVYIETGRLMIPGLPSPDLAIAWANASDPLSWNAAIEQCQFATTAGAVSLLLAVHTDPRQPDHATPAGADIIINLTHTDALAVLVNTLLLFGGVCTTPGIFDVMDLRTIAHGAREAFLLHANGDETGGLLPAAHQLCRQIETHTACGSQIKGAAIFLELDSASNNQELCDATDAFTAALPDDTQVTYSLRAPRSVYMPFCVSALITI